MNTDFQNDIKGIFEFDLRQYLSILPRRKWVILIPILVMSTLVIFAGVIAPGQYAAKAIIMIQDEYTDNPLMEGMAISSSAANRLDIIKKTIFSPGSVAKTIELLQSDPISANRASSFDLKALVEDHVSVEAVTKSRSYGDKDMVVEFACVCGDSILAPRVVNAVVQVFIDETLFPQKTASRSIIKFMQEQIKIYETRLDSADAQLSNFKKNHIYALPGALDFNLKKVIELETELAELDINLAEIAQQKTHLADQLTINSKPLLDKQAELADLQSKYTDRHPRVIELIAEIRELEVRLAGAREKLLNGGSPDYHLIIGKRQNSGALTATPNYWRASFTDNSAENSTKNSSGNGTTNFNQQNPFSAGQMGQLGGIDPYTALLFSDLAKYKDLEIRQKTLTTRKTEMRKKLTKFNEQLQSIPAQEQNLLNLRRDYEVTKSVYDNMYQKLENARISKNLELANELTRFRFLQKAEVPREPMTSKQLMLIIGGILSGIFMGLGFAILAEFFDTNIKSEKDIQRYLGLKNLITLSNLNDERLKPSSPNLS